ncbi:MAG TPA: FAD-dependent thymidylate synthase [Methylomusa anaerophila]|uniref:Flavin-dependent thymidylate synthase n=1 Tax=Methylomusa anaerophila TaxID=1930071 RepID=A0A348AJT3_9FIRM|nr:FAD-dependent thymidylate synthase [Methylomusa anaerophila]BBB91331.1 thymidylate synthase ThyX [Methylomusa anaerophila]HML90494.1 FAD-dependent thymidylate synthase [Methylomusa anaerophila]
MEVKLISKTPDYLKTIWVAARTCYSPLSPVELIDQTPTEEEMLRLIKHVLSNKHLSVVEHCHMTFAVKRVSRTLLAQYSRHRIGVSLSVQSQRYVSEQSSQNPDGLFEFIIPQTVADNEVTKEKFMVAMRKAQEAYDQLLAAGVTKEDARFVLPGSAGTNFVTSLNLRSFLDLYQKRVLTHGAQWEIRNMIIKMSELLLAVEPWLQKFIPKE